MTFIWVRNRRKPVRAAEGQDEDLRRADRTAPARRASTSSLWRIQVIGEAVQAPRAPHGVRHLYNPACHPRPDDGGHPQPDLAPIHCTASGACHAWETRRGSAAGRARGGACAGAAGLPCAEPERNLRTPVESLGGA